MKIQGLSIFMVLTFAAPLWITAQTTNSPAKPTSPIALAPLPENPDSAMAQARQVNGFDESGAKSWHIRAKYEVYDADGDNIDSGVYEEIWAGPRRYRRSYTGPKFTQTDYASANGLYRSGDQQWPEGGAARVRRLLVEPFDYLGTDPQSSLQRVDRKISRMNFLCLAKRPLTNNWIVASGIENYPQDCFETDNGMLRISLNPGVNEGVIRSNAVQFQGRFVARDIKSSLNGKARLTIHLELVEGTSLKGDEMFTPDAGAKNILSGRIQGNFAMTHILYSVPPVYPDVAKIHHVSGKVTMQITLRKDGSVTDVKVLDGPLLLRDAAVESARKWRFKPVLIMGDPVEIDMKLEIMFNLA
jgi:TonB family protein